MVDAGNALWKNTGLTGDEDRARASFILKAMGQMGVQAMAPGARDLVLGPEWLKAQAAAAKVSIVSANLVAKGGKLHFPASRVVEVGGAKVGLIGASPGSSAIAPVRAEAARLRAQKVDLVVVLAAVPYADALQLSRELGGAVDLLLQSHEGRGVGMPQRGEANFVLPTGERGRQLGKLELGPGKGPLHDAGEQERDAQTLALLEGQAAEVERRLNLATDEEAKRALRQTLRQFTERRVQVEGRLQAGRKAGGRKMALEWISLTSEFKEDRALAEGVKRIEPHGAVH